MNQVSVQQAQQMADDGHVLVDVREADEWAGGHALGATHLPLSSLSLEDFPEGKSYLLMCKSGGRSMQAAMALSQRGYDVNNVEGGFQAWLASGLPAQSEDGQPPRVIAP